MLCKAREPFFTADNVSCTHKVIVYCVSKVVCGNSVGLEKNEVFVVFGNFKVALYKVCKLELLFGVAVCKNTKHEGVTCLDVLFNLFDCELTSAKHFCLLLCSLCLPVCILYFFLLIYCVKLVKLFLCCKAGVSLTLNYELLCVSLVDFASHALLVGTVCALVADVAVVAKDRALVEVDAVFSECLDKTFSCASNLSLCVGVFNSKVEYTAGLVSKSFAYCGGEKTAKVNESCGGRSETSYLCALRENSCGISFFHIRRSCVYVRKKQLCKIIVIHKIYVLSFIYKLIHIDYKYSTTSSACESLDSIPCPG